MTITKRLVKGTPLTHAEGDANLDDLSERKGWHDYNDTATDATTGTPIPLTLANTDYKLTNDGLGANTRDDYKITTHGAIWDTALNQFDFASLKVGDMLTIRGDIQMHASGPSRDFNVTLVLGVGSGSEVTLPVAAYSFKVAGSYRRTGGYDFYIGATFVKNYPAELRIQSDSTGDSVTVKGWYVTTEVR